jgi:hypothetical protein
MIGPGKYDDLCTYVRTHAKALDCGGFKRQQRKRHVCPD